MANQLQMVVYEGYLAADPERRKTPTDKDVTNFRMGSNREYRTADGNQVKETTWLKVVAWGKLAEIVDQLCAKGSHVIVTGILRAGPNGSPSVYKLKDETWAASYEITAKEIRVLKGKAREDDYVAEADDEEIPF